MATCSDGEELSPCESTVLRVHSNNKPSLLSPYTGSGTHDLQRTISQSQAVSIHVVMYLSKYRSCYIPYTRFSKFILDAVKAFKFYNFIHCRHLKMR